MLRRSSSSVIQIALRTIGSARPLRGVICIVEKHQLLDKRYRTSSVPSLHFSTAKKRSSTDDSLIRIIDSEIKCAQDSDLPDCVVEIPDGFPFKIQDKPGERAVVLQSGYKDEIIKVEVDMPDTQSEEDVDVDGESDTESSIPLVVSVSRGTGLCLQFNARAFPDRISIIGLSIKEPQNFESPLAYEGPDFLDLDENLRVTFHEYLEIRGLKPSTANFLLEYMISKDSKEYLRWLKNLKKFMGS